MRHKCSFCGTCRRDFMHLFIVRDLEVGWGVANRNSCVILLLFYCRVKGILHAGLQATPQGLKPLSYRGEKACYVGAKSSDPLKKGRD